MNYDDIDKAIDRILALDKWGISVGGKVSEDEISKIEKKLGVNLCEEYKEFLRDYGLLGRSQEYIAGIWSGQPSECSEGTLLYHHEMFESDNFKLDNRTVLDPGGDEYYRIIDHDTGCLYTYDCFSKKYERESVSIKEYIASFVSECLELAKT